MVTGRLMNFMLNGSVFNLSSQWGRVTYHGQTLISYKFPIVFNDVFSLSLALPASEGVGMIEDNSSYYIDTSKDVGTIQVTEISIGI